MELVRTSLKMFNNNRDKTGVPQSCTVDSHFKSNESCKFPSLHDTPTCSSVLPLQRSNFDDFCQIYPCHEPSSRGQPPQPSDDDEANDKEQSHVDVAAKIDRLCTADIVKILLQPAVLDTVVTELEKNFLSE